MKDKEEQKPQEKEVLEIRHKISAEETFTLAKDVFDLRCLIKSIYANRALIFRRLNVVYFVFSLLYTLLYVAFLIFGGVFSKLSLGWEITLYVIFGVYGVMVITLIITSIAVSNRSSAKHLKRHNQALKIFRIIIRISSLAMSITALSISISTGRTDTVGIAIDTVAVIVSIISIIITIIPLAFGGLGNLARWLTSPAKVKKRTSYVMLEWYKLLISDSTATLSTQRVSPEYNADICRCLDEYLIPKLGKKYIGSVTAAHLCLVINIAAEADKKIVEGILKNVFAYATECGYIPENICENLSLSGSIENDQKPKKEPLRVRLGRKLGKKIVNEFLGVNDKDGK